MLVQVTAALLLSLALPAQKSEEVEKARTYFDAGQQAYKAGDYVNAANAFEEAYKLLPNPAITFSIAQSYRLQYFVDRDPRNLRLAIDAYKRYLREQEKGGRRDDALEHLTSLEAQLARIESEGEKVVVQREDQPTRLMITSQTEGAKAAIDDGEPEDIPVTKEVAPGQHKVTVTADGYFTKLKKVHAVEGQLVVSETTLESKPATVDIRAPGGAAVRIDGRLVGVAPLGGPLALEAGKHRIVVSDRGRHVFKTELDVGRGDVRTVQADLARTAQRTVSWWFLGAGAASFIGTAVVVGIAVISEGQARLLNRKVEVEMMNLTTMERDEYIDARDRRNDLLAASSVGLAAGVLFSAVGGLLFFLDEPNLGEVGVGAEPKKQALVPTVGPTGAGLSYSLTF